MKTTGEARARVNATEGEDGVNALEKIVFWYKGMSDAAKERKYQELINPDKVKKEADILEGIDRWMVKLREVESTRPNPVEAWTKAIVIKKILPNNTVEVINAKDDLAGADNAAYERLLKWAIKWGPTRDWRAKGRSTT